jgi:citrate lyase subunit beta/citryl-CoA lyase
VTAGAVDRAALRSLLFAPGSDRRKLAHALASGADAVIADLEDGVAPDEKVAARAAVEAAYAEAGRPRTRGLRVNTPGTEWFEADVELADRLPLDFLVLPKATPAAVAALGPAGTPVLAIVETAEGLLRAHETATAERVFALALGSHDLGAELRTAPRADGLELLYARSKVVADSAAAGRRPPFDTVYLDVQDAAGLERECALGRTLGFRGKLCIHPAQLEAVNRVFGPSGEELAWARRVLTAYERGVREGRGAIAVDGAMVDAPIVRRAEALLAEADDRVAAPSPGRP